MASKSHSSIIQAITDVVVSADSAGYHLSPASAQKVLKAALEDALRGVGSIHPDDDPEALESARNVLGRLLRAADM